MTRVSRSIALQVALAAILLRALVPAGWMPGTTPSHHVLMVVCPMDGAMGDMPAKKAPAHAQHHVLCSYAMAAHAVAPGPSAAPAPAGLIADGGPRDIALAVIATRSHSRQAPRAPPSLA